MTGDKLTRSVAYLAAEATHISVSEMLDRRSFQPLLTRLAKVGLGKALQSLVPGSIDMAGSAYNQIGIGGEQVVYSNGSEVVKVIHRSMSFNKSSAEAAASHYAQTYQIAAEHMEDHVIPTEFDVKRVRAGLFAAIAIQPHVQIQESFRDVHHLVNHDGGPGYLTALETFYAALTRLYNSAGVQMDLNGAGNIVLLAAPKPLLSMVDTLPVSEEMQEIPNPENHIKLGDQLLGRMAVIETALAVPTE